MNTMEEPEPATKAPESDAQDADSQSKNTQAESGIGVSLTGFLILWTWADQSFQEHCVTDRPSREPLKSPTDSPQSADNRCSHRRNSYRRWSKNSRGLDNRRTKCFPRRYRKSEILMSASSILLRCHFAYTFFQGLHQQTPRLPPLPFEAIVVP